MLASPTAFSITRSSSFSANINTLTSCSHEGKVKFLRDVRAFYIPLRSSWESKELNAEIKSTLQHMDRNSGFCSFFSSSSAMQDASQEEKERVDACISKLQNYYDDENNQHKQLHRSIQRSLEYFDSSFSVRKFALACGFFAGAVFSTVYVCFSSAKPFLLAPLIPFSIPVIGAFCGTILVGKVILKISNLCLHYNAGTKHQSWSQLYQTAGSVEKKFKRYDFDEFKKHAHSIIKNFDNLLKDKNALAKLYNKEEMKIITNLRKLFTTTEPSNSVQDKNIEDAKKQLLIYLNKCAKKGLNTLLFQAIEAEPFEENIIIQSPVQTAEQRHAETAEKPPVQTAQQDQPETAQQNYAETAQQNYAETAQQNYVETAQQDYVETAQQNYAETPQQNYAETPQQDQPETALLS